MTTMKRHALGMMMLAALGSGCAVVTANNQELLEARQQMATGNPANALLAVDANKRNDLPAILDRAVFLQEMGKPQESNAEFDQAISKIKEYEGRATVSATEAATGAGSLVLNDKVLEYQGEGFEKVLIHVLKARNYLMLGDEEGARVEIRNANMRQDQERKKYQDAIDAAKNEGEKATNFSALSQEVEKQFAPSAAILRRVDNVYQNPFATYLSGIVYEVNGERDDAFLDFKNAYGMVPNGVVGQDLVRLAKKLKREDEIHVVGQAAGVPVAGGNTLVIIDNGFAPGREEIKFPIPTGKTVLFAAVPITRPVPTNMDEVEIVDADGTVLGKTAIMVDIEAMSVRNLRDRYPGILVRQAIRLAGKAAAGEVASKELGLAGTLLTSAVNAVTEQADLRTWYGLPRSIHVARVNVRPGTKELNLRFLDASGQTLREVNAAVVGESSKLGVVSARYLGPQVVTPVEPTSVAAVTR